MKQLVWLKLDRVYLKIKHTLNTDGRKNFNSPSI